MISDIKEWNDFISLAHEHGIFPVVYYALKPFDTLIPEKILSSMKSYNMNIAKQNMLMTSELIKICKLFDKNNIKYVSFKGPTLSYMAYGDIILRQYCDLDILIDINDILNVVELLEKNKFTVVKNKKFLENNYFIKTTNDFSFFSKNNTHIELHWNLFRQMFNDKAQLIDTWKYNNYIEINKQKISSLGNEFLLVYLCIHGSKHLWERIEWITDINKLINKTDLDWNQVLFLSEKLSSNKMLFLGLSLSFDFYQTKIPNEIVIMFNHDNIIMKNRLFDLYSSNIFREKGNLSHILSKFIIITSLKENNFEKIKYLFSSIFKPTQYDIYFYKLPNKIHFLYYILRPYRFVYNLILNR